mgnify:CR=1 FL=1
MILQSCENGFSLVAKANEEQEDMPEIDEEEEGRGLTAAFDNEA